MPLAGFEPANPVSGRPHTHTLDRAATGIDCNYLFIIIIIIIMQDLKVAMFSSYVLFSPGFRSNTFHVTEEVVFVSDTAPVETEVCVHLIRFLQCISCLIK